MVEAPKADDLLGGSGGGSPLPGGGTFGNFFGNTNAAGGSLPSVDHPGPAQPEKTPPTGPALPGPTGNGSPLPGSPAGPVTAPVAPGTSPLQPGMTDIGHNFGAVNPLDPALTTQLFQYLQGMIGKGATPFSQTTTLPGGGTTGAGDLTAPLNSLMQQLQQFYSGGQTNAPGLNQLNSFTTNGQPIDQTPAWQAMVDSMQKRVGENQANLKEQFNFTGNLAGSPMGNAMSDYMAQTSKDQNAMLLNAQTQAMENAKGRQLNASEDLLGANQQFSGMMQGLDQNAINAKLQEFLRDQPEYSPLLNMMYGAGTTFPPIANFNSGIGVLGALAQNAGGIGDLLGKLGIKLPGMGGGTPSSGGGGVPNGGWGGGGGGDGVGGGGVTTHNPTDYTYDPTTGLQVRNNQAFGGPAGLPDYDPNFVGSFFDYGYGDNGGGDSPLPGGEGDGGFTGYGTGGYDQFSGDFGDDFGGGF